MRQYVGSMSTLRQSPTFIPAHAVLRRLAVEADVDPRTIRAEILAAHGARRPVRGMPGERARRVLTEHGYLPSEAIQR